MLWTLFQFSNLAFGLIHNLNFKNQLLLTMIHSIMMSCIPLNICFVFILAIYYSLTGNTYQMLDIEMDNFNAHEMSQSLLDEMIIRNPPPGMENKVRHQRNPSGSSLTMDKVKSHWGKGENFKDILRREVLEYIVKGFEKIFKGGKHDKSNTFDNLIPVEKEIVEKQDKPSL